MRSLDVGGKHRNVDDQYRNVGHQYRNVDDQYCNVSDQYRNVDDQHRNVSDQYRNVSDQYRNVDDQQLINQGFTPPKPSPYKGEGTKFPVSPLYKGGLREVIRGWQKPGDSPSETLRDRTLLKLSHAITRQVSQFY